MDDYTLAKGSHETPEQGRCAMEWVSYLAGERHGDEPASVSPVLCAFCTTLNDSLEDEPRQRLRPLLARTLGTSEDGLDEARSWMALDWLIRTYAPGWLAAVARTAAARRLSELPPVDSPQALGAAIDKLTAARSETHAAWAQSGSDHGQPWEPGRAAAREVGWSSVGAAVWAAARVHVSEPDADRARTLAREIAGDAAATVTPQARQRRGRAAARDAVQSSLSSEINGLQRSALALLDRMLPGADGPVAAGKRDLDRPVARDVQRHVAVDVGTAHVD